MGLDETNVEQDLVGDTPSLLVVRDFLSWSCVTSNPDCSPAGHAVQTVRRPAIHTGRGRLQVEAGGVYLAGLLASCFVEVSGSASATGRRGWEREIPRYRGPLKPPGNNG